MEREILRPFDSSIPFQFWNDSEISAYVGTVEIVLSQFCTLTVWRVISCTTPSAFLLGIEIQSPGFTILLAESWMLETNPKMVSLNTRIRIAATAPNPAISAAGDFPRITDKIKIVPIK